MGKIGYGYGCEWHLLRYLGYHRQTLTMETLKITGGNSVEWLDFNFSKENAPLKDDREFVGLEFIKDERIQDKWRAYWPQTGTAQNWDAVGQIHFNDHDEWLLVEAKGHIGELKSDCGATHPKSKEKIITAFENTSQSFGNQTKPVENWLKNYYQYANRLAVLHFLANECNPLVNARLLFIYFFGDNRDDAECPQNEEEWMPSIREMKAWLGVDNCCELEKRTHYLFLPVNPLSEGKRSKARLGA
jgi:hypothetical protein